MCFADVAWPYLDTNSTLWDDVDPIELEPNLQLCTGSTPCMWLLASTNPSERHHITGSLAGNRGL